MNTLPQPVKELSLIRHDLENNSVELVIDSKVKEFMELKTSLEAEIKATWRAIEAYMLDNGIKDIYNLTIAERKSWKVDGKLPPRFYREVLDTEMLSLMLERGKLPKNVSYTKKPYLTKVNRKLVEVA